MQELEETTPLLRRASIFQNNGLSVIFAVICIVDVFGVFPVVTLPKAVVDCGYYGIPVVIAVCSVQIYTAILLGKCWELAEKICPSITRRSRYPYSALAEITYGKMVSRWVTVLLDLTVFGAAIPNLIVEISGRRVHSLTEKHHTFSDTILKVLASQNLQLLGLRLSNNEFDVSFCYWIIILGTFLCPVLWFGSPKDMKVLCTVSVFIVTSVFLLVCGCIIFTTSLNTPSSLDNFETNMPLWKTVLLAYGIIAFQFDIHPTILTIQMDMNEKSKLPLAVIGGFASSLSMFTITTIITAVKFGTATQPSILETLPTSVALHFAAALIAIQLCLTSAVSNSALYQDMEDCLNIPREFNYKRCILRTILTMLAIVIAESVPRFDLVMSLVGGTLTGPLVFILPPLFYMKMLYLSRKYEEELQTLSFENVILNKDEDSYSSNLSKYYEQKFREEFKSDIDLSRMKYVKMICNRKFEIFICIVIILTSICTTLITTYLNINSAALSYVNFSKPCIYNISFDLLYRL